MMPSRSIDWRQFHQRRGSKSRRGWSGFGVTLFNRNELHASSAKVRPSVADGRLTRCRPIARRQKRCRPLPSALRGSFLVIGENLFCELNVCFRAFGRRVVEQNRLAVAGRFGQPHTSRDNRSKTSSPKNSRRSAATCRVRLVRSSYRVSRMPSICSGWPNDSRTRSIVSMRLGNAFQGEKLALDGHQNGIRRHQGVQGEKIESGRTINKDVIVIGLQFSSRCGRGPIPGLRC